MINPDEKSIHDCFMYMWQTSSRLNKYSYIISEEQVEELSWSESVDFVKQLRSKAIRDQFYVWSPHHTMVGSIYYRHMYE